MVAERNHIKVFVSSTVYNFEDILNKVYALLDGMGYDVYISHKGTIPLDSASSNADNCVMGVEDCDIFVGFIRPDYGSGVMEDGISITEQEFIKAYKCNVPRFVLADYRIPFTRRLLKWMGLTPSDIPQTKENKDGVKMPNMVVDGRCVKMYCDAISDGKYPVTSRVGNWVQEYHFWDDVRIHLEAQFNNVERLRKLISEHAER